MLNGSCFTVLNEEETEKMLLWAKLYGQSIILQRDGEVELLTSINLILEKKPKLELIAQFDEVESGG